MPSGIVYCYWGTWSHYRTGKGQFRVGDIDPSLCTHLAYAHFGIGDDFKIKSLDPYLDFDLQNIAKTVALKDRNRGLKIMACVGGWKVGSDKFSQMAADTVKRSRFIDSILVFLRQHNFDGIDVDWEFPYASDKHYFVRLLRELKSALRPHDYLLSVAVAADPNTVSNGYDIPQVSRYADLINVMSYDFAGSWNETASFNAPLQGRGTSNVKSAICHWIEKGAEPQKMLLGFPFYGRSFTLSNEASNRSGASVKSVGRAGPYTNEAGTLGYNEICEKLNSGWTRRWNSNQLVPYAFAGDQWVSYDDEDSFNAKIDFLKSWNLAGAMAWSIETDDFRGTCGERFPLLTTLSNGLMDSFEENPKCQII